MMLCSHRFEDGSKLELKKHIQEVADISLEILQAKILNFSLSKEIIERIGVIVSICHDFGKATSYFQKRLDNEKLKGSHTNHALLSAMAGFVVSQNYVQNNAERIQDEWISYIPLMVFYIIAHHHTSLGDLSDSINKPEEEKRILKGQVEKIDDNEINGYIFTYNGINIDYQHIKQTLTNNLDTLIEDEIQERFYELNKLELQHIFLLFLLFSILMEADKTKLILDERDGEKLKEIKPTIIDEYKKNQPFEGSKMIKELRERAFKEIANVKIDLSQKIYSITLPTGLGKTLASLSFALRLRKEINNFSTKIIYCLPFLSIIDQTEKVFNDVFKDFSAKYGSKVLLKDHSLAEVSYKTETEELDINKSEFLISTWDAEIILTTIDRLFYSFFSSSREYIMRFHNLFNAIIILDEVQNINDKLWLSVREFFSHISKLGNSYIILTTATQPVIFEQGIKEIVAKPESYYKKLSRVKLYPNIKDVVTMDEFIKIVLDYIEDNPQDDVMVVLNTVDSSIQVYKAVELNGKKPIYLSSNIIPKERLDRIDKIKDKQRKGKIIITTQCIEAGVDIDVDVVFRDFAPLDSINQVSGRCNRHFLKETGKVFIYRIIDDKNKEYNSYIYGDVHTDITNKALNFKEMGEDKIYAINKGYFEELKHRHYETEEIIANMLEGRFSYTKKFHELLRGNDFLKEAVFVEYDKDSKRVLEDYIKAVSEPNWKERRNKLLAIRKGLAENTISLYKVGKRKGERYLLSDFIDIKYGLNCLDKKHYDKKVGFLPKNELMIF